MRQTDSAVRSQKLKLYFLMGLIALLTLGADAPEDCCPNEEDGQSEPDLITMTVTVKPGYVAVESGKEAAVTVTTQCGLLPCPGLQGWSVWSGRGIYPISAEPNPVFQFGAEIGGRGSLAGADYSPFENRIWRMASISFNPILVPEVGYYTTIQGGDVEVLIWASPDDPEVISLQEESGNLVLGPSLKSFGNVTLGSKGNLWVPAINSGSPAVEITGVKLETVPFGNQADLSQFMIFQPSKVPGSVAPGKSRTISVTFTPASTGTKRVSLVVTSRVSGTQNAKTARVELIGTGVSPQG